MLGLKDTGSVTKANELMSPTGSFPEFSCTQPPLKQQQRRPLSGQIVVFTFQFYLVCWVCVAGEGLQGWLLSEAARTFPGSKSDLPLAKAEPISDDGSASVIAYLRRGKDC